MPLPTYVTKPVAPRVARPIDLTQDARAASFTMADWPKGGWTQKAGSFERNGGGFAIFPKPLGSVQFAIRWQGGKAPAQWLLHYVNEKNFIRCEIGDSGFQAVRVSEGKDTVVLASKRDVRPLQWYQINISIRSDAATLSLHNGTTWEPLGDVAAPGFAETKFGFLVQPGQQLLMSSFEGQSFR